MPDLKIAAKLDLGIVPIDREVRPLLEAAVTRIAGFYGRVDEACPDFRGAMDAFMRLRGPVLYRTLGHLLEGNYEKLTPSVVWNVKRGIGVSADAYLMAEEQRGPNLGQCGRFLSRARYTSMRHDQHRGISERSGRCPPNRRQANGEHHRLHGPHSNHVIVRSTGPFDPL